MKKVRISGAIGISVLLFALTLSMLAWPLGKIEHTEKSGSRDKVSGMTEGIDMQLRAQQTFVPQYQDLQALSVYVANELESDNTAVLNVVLFDKDLEIVSLQEIHLSGESYPGYVRIPTNMVSFTAGEKYYYLAGAAGEPLCLAYTDEAAMKAQESLETYYADVLQEGKSLLTVYEYQAPFHWQDALYLALLCIGCSILLIGVLELLFRICRLNVTVPLRKVLQTDAAVITAVISVTAFIAIGPLQMFTKSIVNIIVYEIGVILFALTCLYFIYGNSGGTAGILPGGILSKIELLLCHLQKFAFAGAILACCHYGNALYTAGQEAASAWIFGCFAAAIVLCIALGFCRIIRDRARNRRRRIRISITYALLTAVLFLLLIVCRNERSWVFKAVIPFTLFYIAYIFAGTPKKIMKNLMDGIIISFILLTAYCLIHRPYHYYRYNRYPMYFHTVTVTGMYLILVISTAFAKFLAVCKERPRIPRIETQHYEAADEEAPRFVLPRFLPSLFMLGVTVSYLLMAVSRIGIVTMLVIFILVTLLTAFCMQEDGTQAGQRILFTIKEGGKRLGILLLGILWCLPICFTATRVIPAVAMQPERTELEEFALMITEQTPPDSELYITFPKFLNLMLNRISTSADEITWKDLFHKEEQTDSLSGNGAFGNAADMQDAASKEAQQETAHTEEESPAEASWEEDTKDYSNGRKDTWKLYLDHLTIEGHPTMQVDKQIAHAHNTYLQSAYDHGIPYGIFFLIFCMVSGFKSIHYYVVRRKRDAYAVFPMIIVLAFGMTSMVEWVFHPCIPLGFAFLAVFAPLIMQPIKRRKRR